MKAPGELMRDALKRHLHPALRTYGFSGKSTLHRLKPDRHDILAVQMHKYGGSFILEFSRIPRGPLETSWSEPIPEEKITVAHTPVSSRARLVDPTSEDLFEGFNYADFGDSLHHFDELAKHVASLTAQIDSWLEYGIEGPNVSSFA